MTIKPQKIIIRRPDDWHIHLRDGPLLKEILPYTSTINRRAMIMPNIIPPVTNIKAALDYRTRILAALPIGHSFDPLMTCYLTDSSDPDEIESGYYNGVFTAAKLYPIHSTTNSKYGVTNINLVTKILEKMEKISMPILIHCEVTDANIDIFDREARFLETVLEPLHRKFPQLKITIEHITTKEAAEYVAEGNEFIGATITPHHLMLNRNHMLVNGLRPHLYCMPILKKKNHTDALRKLIASGNRRVFLGSDTAPHIRINKETQCGCAGIFNAPNALLAYATVFEEMNALEHFEKFCSENGPNFYGLPLNIGTIKLVRHHWKMPDTIVNNTLVPFLAGENLNWCIK